MRIAIANLKGGAGKTTLAVGLAEAAAGRGATLLVDADPQGSAMRWADLAASSDGSPLRSVAVAIPSADLPRRLASMQDSYRTIILDTPPGHPAIVGAAIDWAEVALVPVAPSLLDVDRLTPTLELAAEVGCPAAVVLSRTRQRTRALVATREALQDAGLPVLTAEVPQREAIAATFGLGLPAELLETFRLVLDELTRATRRI